MTGSPQKLSPSRGFLDTVGEDNTDNWVGTPGAGGKCVISLNADNSVRFTWSGGTESGEKKYPFNINEDLTGSSPQEWCIRFTTAESKE